MSRRIRRGADIKRTKRSTEVQRLNRGELRRQKGSRQSEPQVLRHPGQGSYDPFRGLLG